MKLNKKYLKNIILEVLGESEFYDKYKDIDTDYATQAMELGQSMDDEGARDRVEQVEKYVRLKVDKEIKKELISQTEWAARELIKEAAGAWGIKGDEINSSFYEDEMEFFTKRYTNRLAKALEIAEQFDGTQESVNTWTQEMMRVERVLYKSRDVAMEYLGSIIPYVLHIGDAFWQSYQDIDPDFGGHYKKSVELQTAVKEAEDFYRPGIMKMVLKAQSAGLGMNLGQMFGLEDSFDNEGNKLNEGEEESQIPDFVKDLLSEEDFITQGVELLATSMEIYTIDTKEIDWENEREWVFTLSSKQEALKLYRMLKDFYETEYKREIYVSIGWLEGPTQISIRLPNL